MSRQPLDVNGLLRAVRTAPTQRSAPALLPSSLGHAAGCIPERTALVLDCSGSMNEPDWAPSRFEGAKAAAVEFLRARHSINPNARAAIIGFSDSAIVASRLGLISQGSAERAVAQLATVGGTNLAAGLRCAMNELGWASGVSLAGGEVVVLTDGHTTHEDQVLSLASDAQRAGCVVHVVGIGGTPQAVNEKLLAAAASRGADGAPLYRFIADRNGLVRHFAQIGGGITR